MPAFAGAVTYAEGGSSLTIAGTLDNTGTVQVGSVGGRRQLTYGLNAPTTVTLGGLTNPAGRELQAGGLGGPPGDVGLQRRRQRVYQQRRRFRADLRRAADPRRRFTNSGTFGLHNNTAVTISGGFTNSGTLDVDNAVAALPALSPMPRAAAA